MQANISLIAWLQRTAAMKGKSSIMVRNNRYGRTIVVEPSNVRTE